MVVHSAEDTNTTRAIFGAAEERSGPLGGCTSTRQRQQGRIDIGASLIYSPPPQPVSINGARREGLHGSVASGRGELPHFPVAAV